MATSNTPKKRTGLNLKLNIAGLLGDKQINHELNLEFNPRKLTKGALETMRTMLEQAQTAIEEHLSQLKKAEEDEGTAQTDQSQSPTPSE